MLKLRITRPLAAGATALALTAGFIALAPSASATVIGSLSFTPQLGSDTGSITLNTSGPCTDVNATNLQVKMVGNGFPAGGQNVVSNSPLTAYGTNAAGGYTVPLADTMRGFANGQTPPATLTGRYDYTLICRTATGSASLGDFTGSLWFTSSTTYQDVDPAGSQPTTTQIASNLASPQQEGTAITFTATVSPTGYAGTVQFADNGTAIGSPQPVNSSGIANYTTSTLGVGNSHSITATYTPSVTGLANSTSTALPYTISPAPAANTTTTLSVSPASGTATRYDNVTLTAAVTPVAAGSFVFKDGGVTVNTVPAAGGTASLTKTYAAGPHSFTASFVPADSARYNPSTSSAIAYDVNAANPAFTSETINTTVDPGTLTLSVVNSVVNLPAPTLTSDGRYLTTSGDMNAVAVVDTRAGNPGWVLSGQVTDFQGPGSQTINGSNLGWSPFLVDQVAAQTVSPGGVVAPGAGLAPGAAAPAGVGLKSARTLASAPSGAGNGTAHVNATLSLQAPTSTLDGAYTATLTLTAL